MDLVYTEEQQDVLAAAATSGETWFHRLDEDDRAYFGRRVDRFYRPLSEFVEFMIGLTLNGKPVPWQRFGALMKRCRRVAWRGVLDSQRLQPAMREAGFDQDDLFDKAVLARELQVRVPLFEKIPLIIGWRATGSVIGAIADAEKVWQRWRNAGLRVSAADKFHRIHRAASDVFPEAVWRELDEALGRCGKTLSELAEEHDGRLADAADWAIGAAWGVLHGANPYEGPMTEYTPRDSNEKDLGSPLKKKTERVGQEMSVRLNSKKRATAYESRAEANNRRENEPLVHPDGGERYSGDPGDPERFGRLVGLIEDVLGPVDSEIYLLRVIEELPFQTIGARVGMARTTVSERFQKAEERVSIALAEKV